MIETEIRIQLPVVSRGRRGAEAEARYQAELRAFCDGMKELVSRLPFAPGTRSWCYIMEPYGLGKGDFDRAERLITDCRKSGDLPLDIVGDDETRDTVGLIATHDPNSRTYADQVMNVAMDCIETYTPLDFWDDQPVYVEMAVEKMDLRHLFEPICAAYRVPIFPLRGWCDLNARAKTMRRMQNREAQGKQLVLLYCGDLDPGGLQISGFLKKNLADLTPAVGWSPDALTIDRFGLNVDFVEQQGLTWIENLETGSGDNLADPKHQDHDKPYVQEYLRTIGPRKVEANALMARPDAGRQLCRDAIERYIPKAAVKRHERALGKQRKALRRLMPEVIRQFVSERIA
jgi:hypothetical protein